MIIGATANILELMGRGLQAGRFFTPVEVDARRKVTVLGPQIAQDVFGGLSPLGERIKIRGNNYQVIGIAAAQGSIGP